MRKIAIMPFLCLVLITGVHAQAKFNTYGDIGAGLVMPQGTFKNYFNSGFQASAEINGRLYKPLWLYLGGSYQSFTPANSTSDNSSPTVSTVGITAGLKIFPVKFIYINGGGGLLANITQSAPTTTDVYFNFGAGVYLLKFLGVFANYNIWQQQNGANNNYLVAGVDFALGRR